MDSRSRPRRQDSGLTAAGWWRSSGISTSSCFIRATVAHGMPSRTSASRRNGSRADTSPTKSFWSPTSATTPWGAKAANSSSLGAGFGWRIARGPRCRAGCCAPVVLAGRSRLGHTDGSTSLRRVEHPGQSRCYWRPLRRLSGLGFSSRPHWTSGRHLASWGSSMSPRLHLPRHLDLRQRGAKAQGSDDAALPLNSQGAGWAARARPEGTTLAAERGNARLGLCTNKSAISHC